MLSKVNKTTGLLQKLQSTLPKLSLFTIYKSFVRPHLHYDNIIYYQTYNATFQQKVESIQHNAVLAITGAIRGTYKEELLEELGFASLERRWWHRKVSSFIKF